MLFSCCLNGGTAKECFPTDCLASQDFNCWGQDKRAAAEGPREDRRVLMDSPAGQEPHVPQDRKLLPSHITGTRTPSVPQVGHQAQLCGVGDAGSRLTIAKLC